MTRSVAAYPNGTGYALGSVEGRVAMELYDTRPEVQQAKYAFKVSRGAGREGGGGERRATHAVRVKGHGETRSQSGAPSLLAFGRRSTDARAATTVCR